MCKFQKQHELRNYVVDHLWFLFPLYYFEILTMDYSNMPLGISSWFWNKEHCCLFKNFHKTNKYQVSHRYHLSKLVITWHTNNIKQHWKKLVRELLCHNACSINPWRSPCLWYDLWKTTHIIYLCAHWFLIWNVWSSSIKALSFLFIGLCLSCIDWSNRWWCFLTFPCPTATPLVVQTKPTSGLPNFSTSISSMRRYGWSLSTDG